MPAPGRGGRAFEIQFAPCGISFGSPIAANLASLPSDSNGSTSSRISAMRINGHMVTSPNSAHEAFGFRIVGHFHADPIPSHSSLLPARKATLPNRTVPVRAPAQSKLHPVGLPVLHAANRGDVVAHGESARFQVVPPHAQGHARHQIPQGCPKSGAQQPPADGMPTHSDRVAGVPEYREERVPVQSSRR